MVSLFGLWSKLSTFTGDQKILTLNAVIMRSLRVLAWSRSVWKIINNSNIPVHVFTKTELGKNEHYMLKTMGACFLYLKALKGVIQLLAGKIKRLHSLRASSPFGAVARSHATAARERRRVLSRLALLIKGELASRLEATVQVASYFPLS